MERNYLVNPLTVKDIEKFRLAKEKYDNSKIYTMEDEFVFIHKTNYAPTNNEIKSKYKSKACYTCTGKLFDQKFEFAYPQGDNYIHFSLNCEVSGDDYDIYGFNNKKYAVVVPANSHEFNQIAFFHSNDIEFKETKNITNCYIICPLSEAEMLKTNNPLVNIVPYIGEAVDGYAEVLASHLGFTIENTSGHDCIWTNDSPNRTSKVLKKYEYEFIPFGMDRWQSEHEIQMSLEYVYLLKKIIEISLQQHINIFYVMEHIDYILARNLINVPSQIYGIDVRFNNANNEEENSFWASFLSNGTFVDKYWFIDILRHVVPFEIVKEEYRNYTGKRL